MLLGEFQSFPSMLTVYMAAQMYDALTDLLSIGRMAPDGLFDRFLAWARMSATLPDDPDRSELDRSEPQRGRPDRSTPESKDTFAN